MLKKIFLSIFIFFVVVILGLFIFIKINSIPVSSGTKLQSFVVTKGDGINSIGAKLEKKQLIKNKYVFIFYSYLLGLNKKIQSGSFRLSPSMTTKEIAVKLSKGGSIDYWLQIKGGNRVEEIANLFPKDIPFNYRDFLVKAEKEEGKLFPDSYLIPQYFTVDQILEVINKSFLSKISEAKINSTNNKLSEKEILVFASLLEREGRTLESKQKIAGILMNRLEIGMPLQIDATVQYVRDTFHYKLSSQNPPNIDFWQPVSKQDISLDSPFNTYKNKGLPPSPICNPGYNSLYAAYHPIASDNLFYITDDDGVMHYAKTLNEHNKNIQKYLK